MKQVILLSICVFSALMLSACGPIYKTEYAYVPPKSDTAKMCTAQCIQSKNMCQQMCQMRTDQCRVDARRNAMYEYEVYKQDNRRAGRETSRDIQSFDNGYTCNSSCDCEPSYNACYSACGGQVLERKVCTAFCDKK